MAGTAVFFCSDGRTVRVASRSAKPTGRTSWSRGSVKIICWGAFGVSARGIVPSASSGRNATISSQIRASPKSVILRTPSPVMSKLPGLMSRWQLSPCRVACSIPWQNWTPNRSRLDQVEPATTDPANQVPALNQFKNYVRLALDDLYRVSLDDVGMPSELHPEPALGGKPRPPDLVTQQLVLQGLECDYRPSGLAQVVVNHVNQAHSTFVHVKDFVSVSDPVAHTPDARHERVPHLRISLPCTKPPILPALLYARSSLWFGHPQGLAKEIRARCPEFGRILH